MKKIIVTTSVKTTLELNDSAQKLADELNLEYVKRNKTTIKQLLETAKGVIVVYRNKLSYFDNDSEFFFHLDTTALKIKNSDNEPLVEIMRNIITYNYDCIDYLKSTPDNSFDIVYFDPMFSHNIKESENLSGITLLADKSFPYEEFIKEASRIGKDKIIIKAHFKDNIFEKYNFTRIVRKNTKFHFGFLEINEKPKN